MSVYYSKIIIHDFTIYELNYNIIDTDYEIIILYLRINNVLKLMYFLYVSAVVHYHKHLKLTTITR